MEPQVPFAAAPAALLHAWQSLVTPPPQALLQQYPSTQNPLGQLLLDVHVAEPELQSYI